MDKQRLQELAGVKLDESGSVRAIGASIAEDIIKQATSMVKPAYRNDKRKIQEYIEEIMQRIDDELQTKNFYIQLRD